MKAIILAAGRGSRMGALTNNLPKCRTKFHGKQLIEWQLEALNHAAIGDVAIVRGYLANTFDINVTYFENERWQESNMVVSLLKASPWLEKSTCLISYSDIVYSPESVEKLIISEGEIVVAYDPHWYPRWKLRFDDPMSDAESFLLKNECLVEIGKKYPKLEEVQGQYIGLLKMSPTGWNKVRSYLSTLRDDAVDKLDMTGLLSDLIDQGVKVKAVAINEPWYEIDSESDLRVFSAHLELTGNETVF